jgi:hypothetical protein
LTGLFPVTPRQEFPMGQLQGGKVNLSILDVLVYPNNPSADVVDTAGGELAFDDGVSIQFIPEAVGSATAVNAQAPAGEEVPGFEASNLTYAGGIDLRLFEETIVDARGLKINLPDFGGYADLTPVFITKHVAPYSASDWTVVATGKIISGYAVIDACSTAKCFAGIEGWVNTPFSSPSWPSDL